jgi:hypothetical protein
MRSPRDRVLVTVMLLLAGFSIAPAAPRAPDEEPAMLAKLAQARYQTALEQYELMWAYFQQNRTDSSEVYFWSRQVLASRTDLGGTPADHVAALKDHLARMKKMEDLIKRIRRLGFGLSSDVGATRYFCLEAEYWLAQATEKGR